MGTIKNGKNTPLGVDAGTIPDVSTALDDWFQAMVFERVVKETVGFEVVETATQINFWGVIQRHTDRELLIKPEGQRAWTWFWVHSEPQLALEVDEVINYLGVQTRVMSKMDYGIYGYISYEICQDWTGSGPGVT